MNLSKELKKKRDAEDRLRQTSPTKIFIDGTGYIDLSQFANKNHTHKFIDLSDTPNDYVADKFVKVNADGTAFEYGGGEIVEIPQATELALGGIKAAEKTTETAEVKIDTATGKLYAPVSSGTGGGTDAESILTKPIAIPTFTGKDGYILAYNETNGEFYLKADEGGGGGGFERYYIEDLSKSTIASA